MLRCSFLILVDVLRFYEMLSHFLLIIIYFQNYGITVSALRKKMQKNMSLLHFFAIVSIYENSLNLTISLERINKVNYKCSRTERIFDPKITVSFRLTKHRDDCAVIGSKIVRLQQAACDNKFTIFQPINK